ncbi:MAG: N-acetylmuramoyl-L-alanine amidase, partial [Planctomycetes bacterium]|nr:N-acetylmuramoyl-L-alanine amidase [Planctomycetota bacterium]
HITSIYKIINVDSEIVIQANSDFALVDGVVKKYESKPLKLISGRPHVLSSLIRDFQYLSPGTYVSSIKKTYLNVKNQEKVKNFKVVIDPGHGGKDPGTNSGDSQLIEKTLTLDISMMIDDFLKKRGFQVFLSRSNDRTLSLEERVAFSKSLDADLFVSIHCNSSSDEQVSGFEIFIKKKVSDKRILTLARFIREGLSFHLNVPDRGIKRKNFYVIKNSRCPSVLVELDFITNETVAKHFKDENYKRDVANAVADGIIRYFNYITD